MAEKVKYLIKAEKRGGLKPISNVDVRIGRLHLEHSSENVFVESQGREKGEQALFAGRSGLINGSFKPNLLKLTAKYQESIKSEKQSVSSSRSIEDTIMA